jgi:hypothetical protein
MKKILFIILLFAACKKDDQCITPGNIEIVSKSIITWSNKTTVIIEIKGIDGPYHGFIYPKDMDEHRVEGHAMIRVKTECSQWSDWYEVNY